jgi:hypothetical protein
MHYMHDLKDLLCVELEDYAEKGKKSGKMSMGDLETVHKLTDTVKNIMKIDVLKEEAGYSEDGTYMGEGRIYGTSYDDGMHREGGYSYDRGRRYARRDSMGRYSRDGGMTYRDGRGMRGGYSRDEGKHYMMEQLEEMMEEAEKPAEKEALRRCMDALKRA